MDLKKLTIKEFDKAAEHFEDNTPSVYNLCKKDYPDILREINKENWHSVLDAGCGTAAVIELLSRKYPDKEYTGIDISEKMIDVANKKHLKNARFVQGDCENLPFEKESFDAVICSQSFHHYTDPQAFFNSVSRVLKNGGRLILRDMSTNIMPVYWFVNHKQALLRETLRVLKKGSTFAIHDLMSPIRYGNMQKFVSELKKEGYEKVELIDTTNNMFMSRREAIRLQLGGSTLMTGRK